MNGQTISSNGANLDRLIREHFQHQVILLSSWADRVGLSDRQRWNLARLLDASRRRLTRQINDTLPQQATASGHGTTHPAFRAFLLELAVKNLPDTPHGNPVVRSRRPDVAL